MLATVTFDDVVVTLHVLGVVVTFGGALVYPIWFRLLRDAGPQERAFFHGAQAKLGKLLIMPGIVVIFATGAYLASDWDLWGEGWVIVPTVILVVILVVGAALLGPSEERLSQVARGDDRSAYDAALGRVKAVTWLLVALVVTATFLMIAHVPD